MHPLRQAAPTASTHRIRRFRTSVGHVTVTDGHVGPKYAISPQCTGPTVCSDRNESPMPAITACLMVSLLARHVHRDAGLQPPLGEADLHTGTAVGRLEGDPMTVQGTTTTSASTGTVWAGIAAISAAVTCNAAAAATGPTNEFDCLIDRAGAGGGGAQRHRGHHPGGACPAHPSKAPWCDNVLHALEPPWTPL